MSRHSLPLGHLDMISLARAVLYRNRRSEAWKALCVKRFLVRRRSGADKRHRTEPFREAEIWLNNPSEPAVELFPRGGGCIRRPCGAPAAQMAFLPGTSHVGMLERADWLLASVPPFLDVPHVGS